MVHDLLFQVVILTWPGIVWENRITYFKPCLFKINNLLFDYFFSYLKFFGRFFSINTTFIYVENQQNIINLIFLNEGIIYLYTKVINTPNKPICFKILHLLLSNIRSCEF